MTDSVSKLKELLFDREAATLSGLQQRIELVADATRRTQGELSGRVDRLESDVAQSMGKLGADLSQSVAGLGNGVAESIHRLGADLSGRVETVSGRLAELERRAGSPAALRASVAEVMDEAIVEARESRHDHMTRAVAPLVIKTIKTELRNSQDEMVEALYPITGRLVKSYVASAMKDMMNQINRRLEMNPLMLRFRSLASGYSMAELALAETQRLEVDELYLIQRGSGALMQRWPEGAARSNSDVHMSGVLTAINDFASHAFQNGAGNLRSFELDDATVLLRASPLYLLAAKCRGAALRSVEQLVDQEFLEIVSQLHDLPPVSGAGGAAIPPNLLSNLKLRLESGIADRHEQISRAGLPFHPLKALAGLAVMLLLAGGGWWAWTSWEREQTRSTAQAIIADLPDFQGYPVQLEAGWRGRTLSLNGIVPSADAKSRLLAKLRVSLPEVEVSDALAVLPGAGPDTRPQIAEVRQQLGALEAEITRRAMKRALDRAAGRLDQTMPELDQIAALVDMGRKPLVDKSRSELAGALRELDQQRRAVVGGADTSVLQAALRRVASELQRIAGELAALVGEASQPRVAAPRTTPAGGADPTEIAEEVSLAAERLATMATAVARASAIRFPDQTPGPLERLRTFARTNVIFFGKADEFRSPDKAEAVIAEMARLMRGTTALVRVVGYTDERGGTPRNGPISQARADKVMQALIQQGVPRDRLIALGRPNGPDLSASAGPQSPNRRVEFEVGFDGETAAGP